MERILSIATSGFIPQHTIVRMGNNSFAVYSSRTNEIVIVRMPHQKTKRFKLNPGPPNSNESPSFRIAGIGEDQLIEFNAIDSTLTSFDSEGAVVGVGKSLFEIQAVEALGSNLLLAFGLYKGRQLHCLRHDGSILNSHLPISESIGANVDPYYCDKRIVITNQHAFVLRESRAGIIDLLKTEDMSLQRRFALSNRDKNPIFQFAAFRPMSISARSSNDNTCPIPGEPSLFLTFPIVSQQFQLIAAAGDDELVALLGDGTALIHFDRMLSPKRVLRLPRIYEDSRHPANRIFSILRLDSGWIACAVNGDVWHLDQSDFVSEEIGSLAFTLPPQAGHPAVPLGTVPLLNPNELERFGAIWRGMELGTCSFSAMVDETGMVRSIDARQFAGLGIKPSGYSDILMEAFGRMRFTPRYQRGKPVPTSMSITVSIDGFATSLLNQYTDNIVSFE